MQENVTAQPVSFGKGPAAPLELEDDGGATLLAALTDQPFYLAKCLIAARAGHPSVMQQFQS